MEVGGRGGGGYGGGGQIIDGPIGAVSARVRMRAHVCLIEGSCVDIVRFFPFLNV